MILEKSGGFGEIAPLPHFSKETFEEAKEELIRYLKNPTFTPKCPSVRWGLLCASRPLPLGPLKLPIACLEKPQGPTLKLKLGSLSLEEALIKLSPLVGKYSLRLDFNRMWPLEKSLQFVSHFSPLDFDYLEEPAPTLSELIVFSKNTQFPIGVDESLSEKGWEKIPTLKAAVVKPMLLGRVPKIPPHIKMVLSSSYESSLGILLLASISSREPSGLDTFSDDLLDPPLSIQDGFLVWKGVDFHLRRELLCSIAL